MPGWGKIFHLMVNSNHIKIFGNFLFEPVINLKTVKYHPIKV